MSKKEKDNENLLPYLKGEIKATEDEVTEVLSNFDKSYGVGSVEEIILLLGNLSYIFNYRMDYFEWIENNIV